MTDMMNTDNFFELGHVYLDEPEIMLADSPEEKRSLEIYTTPTNGDAEEGGQHISSDDLMNISTKDFMLVNRIPELPAANDGEAGKCTVVKEERDVVALDEVQQRGSSPASNPSSSHVTLLPSSRFGRCQKPPGRDSSRKRNFGEGPSKVNGEVTSITQIIIESSEVASKNPGSHVIRGRRDSYRLKKIKQRSISTRKMNERTVEEPREIPGCSSAPEPRTKYLPEPQRGRNLLPKPAYSPAVSNASHPAPDIVQIPQNLVHQEGAHILATTKCPSCLNTVEHKLYTPGNWPPNHCPRCHSKWIIMDWKQIVPKNDDDEVECLGVYPGRRRMFINPIHVNSRVKLEPVDERLSVPSCNLCGGHHAATNARSNGQNYCPFYGAPGNPNYRMWN
ncbi:uncharacterized protein LOC124161110 isoform X2 [Ischnura elegans]|uniref:uncharacterized protein LOC124161110 isoform X2 n=1 Tax=Ischnura elegans TaxID=197161 RepID=UPI001ED8B1D3|nr:uncharacterized protein LOC124161110 isoform X2 [Ischnura elegans]